MNWHDQLFRSEIKIEHLLHIDLWQKPLFKTMKGYFFQKAVTKSAVLFKYFLSFLSGTGYIFLNIAQNNILNHFDTFLVVVD